MDASNRSWAGGFNRAALKTMLALVACWFGWQAIRTGHQMISAARSDDRQSLSARAFAGGAVGGLNTAFLAWAQRRMLASSSAPTYRLLTASNPSSYLLQWSMFQLSPARQVTTSRAGWLVVYGATTRVAADDAGAHGRVFAFAPGFELVERHR